MSDIEVNAADPADIDSYVETVDGDEPRSNGEPDADRETDADPEPRPKPLQLSAGIDAIGGELLEHIVEGALLTAGKPLTIADIGALFEDHERPAADDLRAALAAIGERYAGRGFELREVASGFRFQVVQNVATWIARLWEEKPQRYSRALLETLSLIAYRQPITRGDIEDIRGVAVATNIMKTLLEREWVRIVGHKDVPGRPAMYATTRKFLDYFNLKNLDELPPLAEIRDLDSLNAELSLEGADTPLLDLSADAGTDAESTEDDETGDDVLEASVSEAPVTEAAIDDSVGLGLHPDTSDAEDAGTAPADAVDDGTDNLNFTADDGDEPPVK